MSQTAAVPEWSLGWRLRRALEWVGVSAKEMAVELDVSEGTKHRFATRGYAGTRDLFAGQAALGHSTPETTKRYTDVPADAMLAFVQAAGS